MTKEQKITLSLQQLVEERQKLNSRMKSLQQKAGTRSQILAELFAARDTLNHIKDSKTEEKIMVDLGAGVYIEAKIDVKGKVQRSFAGNIIIDKKAENVLKDITTDIEKVQKDIEAIQQEMGQLVQSQQGIDTIIGQIQQKQFQDRKK